MIRLRYLGSLYTCSVSVSYSRYIYKSISNGHIFSVTRGLVGPQFTSSLPLYSRRSRYELLTQLCASHTQKVCSSQRPIHSGRASACVLTPPMSVSFCLYLSSMADPPRPFCFVSPWISLTSIHILVLFTSFYSVPKSGCLNPPLSIPICLWINVSLSKLALGHRLLNVVGLPSCYMALHGTSGNLLICILRTQVGFLSPCPFYLWYI